MVGALFETLETATIRNINLWPRAYGKEKYKANFIRIEIATELPNDTNKMETIAKCVATSGYHIVKTGTNNILE